jgi:hypothetical protein
MGRAEVSRNPASPHDNYILLVQVPWVVRFVSYKTATLSLCIGEIALCILVELLVQHATLFLFQIRNKFHSIQLQHYQALVYACWTWEQAGRAAS